MVSIVDTDCLLGAPLQLFHLNFHIRPSEQLKCASLYHLHFPDEDIEAQRC